MNSERRVVITGLGVATPLGLGVESLWDGLNRGRCGIRRIESFDPAGFPTRVAGELPEFKLGDYIPKSYRKSIKVMSRDIQIAVVCANLAVKDAGLVTRCLVERGEAAGPVLVDGARFGANIGAGLVCADLAELAGALRSSRGEDGTFDMSHWGTTGMGNLTPLWLLKFLPNMLACHVTIVHDAQGPSNTIVSGEASSHLAIGEAFRTIARGDADVCICGGAESKVNPHAMARPQLLRRLNTECNDDPGTACRPFCEQARGTVISEGGGLLIAESLPHAQARGARMYAEIAGFGAGCRSTHTLEPDQRGSGFTTALRQALRDAGVGPERIDLAIPFGTGHAAFDRSEAAAWRTVFGQRLADIPAMTTRGAMGVNGAGSGAIDIAASLMAMRQNSVPASLNTDPPLPECAFRFHEGSVDARIDHVATMAGALSGGQCAALVLKRIPDHDKE